MCSTSKIVDPMGFLYGGSAKWADPLGVTKTSVGDPTGRVRRARQSDLEERKGTHYTLNADGSYSKGLGGVPQPKTALGS